MILALHGCAEVQEAGLLQPHENELCMAFEVVSGGFLLVPYPFNACHVYIRVLCKFWDCSVVIRRGLGRMYVSMGVAREPQGRCTFFLPVGFLGFQNSFI